MFWDSVCSLVCASVRWHKKWLAVSLRSIVGGGLFVSLEIIPSILSSCHIICDQEASDGFAVWVVIVLGDHDPPLSASFDL